MDFERDERRHRYRLFRVGFALIALGLGLLCIDWACSLAVRLVESPELRRIIHSRWWDWLVGAPITWGTLIGSYLLWGRSTDPSWQRRAGLLVIMNGIDLLLWTLFHGDALGLRIGALGHEWFNFHLTNALGCAEFILFASLAADTLVELGDTDAYVAGASARFVAGIGLSLWLVSFLVQTDWPRGWPLHPAPIMSPLIAVTAVVLMFAEFLLMIIASFKVTELSIAASRQCGCVLAQMHEEDQSHELLRSRSEPFDDDQKTYFYQDDDVSQL